MLRPIDNAATGWRIVQSQDCVLNGQLALRRRTRCVTTIRCRLIINLDHEQMCGRFTSTASPEELMRQFGVTILENLRPRWNVAPTQSSVIIRQDGLHTEAVQAKWGLPPATSKQSFLINARMETVREKITFRDAFAHSRCIVPASGWYEWSEPKRPWHIQRGDAKTMVMAGLLFQRGEQTHFVIMTSAADGNLQNIHHRAPLVIPHDECQTWLNGTPEQAAGICRAAPSDWFNWYRVSSAVGKVSADHPGLVTPLTAEDMAHEAHEARTLKPSRSKLDAGQGDLFG